MSVSLRRPGGARTNWPAGVRGLVIALALFGMSTSTGWSIYPAGAVLLYTLASPFGLGAAILSGRFVRRVIVLAAVLVGFTVLFVWCAFLVNAPVPVVSVMGGIAMLLLLGSAVAGTILHALRMAVGKCPAVLRCAQGWFADGREKVSWIRVLVALQFAASTRATTDR
jgi:hypothetical protein